MNYGTIQLHQSAPRTSPASDGSRASWSSWRNLGCWFMLPSWSPGLGSLWNLWIGDHWPIISFSGYTVCMYLKNSQKGFLAQRKATGNLFVGDATRSTRFHKSLHTLPQSSCNIFPDAPGHINKIHASSTRYAHCARRARLLSLPASGTQ